MMDTISTRTKPVILRESLTPTYTGMAV